MMHKLFAIALGIGLCFQAASVMAQVDPHAGHAHGPGDGHGHGHGQAQVEDAAHGAGKHDKGGHAAGHHVPHFSDINWLHGFVGEKEGVEPSFLWRPKGMPAPLGATLVNTALLLFVVVRFGRQPIADALKKRKHDIMTGMDEAARMRKEATLRVKEYKRKLKHIDDEIVRVRREMREAGEAERARILGEAKERRERMARDAQLLVEQERKAARETLFEEAVRGAVHSAEEILIKKVSAQDHQRVAEDYLKDLGQSKLGGVA